VVSLVVVVEVVRRRRRSSSSSSRSSSSSSSSSSSRSSQSSSSSSSSMGLDSRSGLIVIVLEGVVKVSEWIILPCKVVVVSSYNIWW